MDWVICWSNHTITCYRYHQRDGVCFYESGKDRVVAKADWNQYYIINLFKGKGDPLWPKIVTQKILERVRPWYWLMICSLAGCGTTDAILILRQLQEKRLVNGTICTLYLTFVSLINCISRKFYGELCVNCTLMSRLWRQYR